MAYSVTITGYSTVDKEIFRMDAPWISGFHLIGDSRFKVLERELGWLDMSVSLSVEEMREFHKEHRGLRDGLHDEELKFINDALYTYGENTYSRFIVRLSEW